MGLQSEPLLALAVDLAGDYWLQRNEPDTQEALVASLLKGALPDSGQDGAPASQNVKYWG